MSSEKKPTFAAPSKITRQLSVPPSSTRKMMNATTSRILSTPQQKANPNATVLDGDCTVRAEAGDSFDWKFEFKRGEFMRTWLTEILADEKFEHEEKVMDVQLAQLADRFQKTYDLLDNTSKRMKDISFVVEQKRLLDLRTQDCAQFYDITTSSDIENKVSSVITAQQASLDKLETKNVDVGYNKESGHKKLLDAVTEALEGLEQIKNNSNLDPDKLAEYSKSAKSLAEVEKDRIDLESLKDEFDAKYSWYNDAVLKDTSEKLDLLLKIGEKDPVESDED